MVVLPLSSIFGITLVSLLLGYQLVLDVIFVT